jgi:NADPH-dependent 2,4-dienoyl-CoA reductase/sulfur reductase-like enzyme
VAVQPDHRLIHLESVDLVFYDRLVLASGGQLYVPMESEDNPGIYNFKSPSAAEELIYATSLIRVHWSVLYW